MKITLVIPENLFSSNKDIDNQIKKAIGYNCFDRCEIPLKNDKGINFANRDKEYSRLQRCIDVIRKHGLELSLTYSVYEDKTNSNIASCCYEATRTGRIIKLSRVCPNNKPYNENISNSLTNVINKLNLLNSDKIVFSYFRYQNLRQCVCDTCLTSFKKILNEYNITFTFNGFKDLLQKDVLLHWALFRQNAINNSLNLFSEATDNKCIVEIDFDRQKRYLEGVSLEEGLDYPSIITSSSEIYLHIEPAESVDIIYKMSNNQRSGYMNHLKYLRHLSESKNTTFNLFFWRLGQSDEQRINHDLSVIIKLCNAIQLKHLALLTTDPVRVAKFLSNMDIN